MKGLDALESDGYLVVPVLAKTIIVAATTFLVTLPLAQLCHRYVELPGIEFGRWCEQRVRAALAERFAPAPLVTQDSA